MPNSVFKITGLLLSVAMMVNSFAFECSSYEQMQAQLQGKYGEQVVFSGFSDSEESQSASVIYEFWANPRQGNWSLLANKLIIFEYNGKTVNKNCLLLLDSGKRHHLVETGTDTHTETGIAESDKLNAVTGDEKGLNTDDDDTPLYNCVPRVIHAQTLKKHHNEEPVLQGLSDEALIEIYASDNSWTITQVRAREVRNVMTGTTLTDDLTGQEIHQFCSSPSYSGKSWSLHPLQERSI